jgi:hypothetical protein
MRLGAQTEEEKEAERKEFMKAWEKAKMNFSFFTPAVPDENGTSQLLLSLLCI